MLLPVFRAALLLTAVLASCRAANITTEPPAATTKPTTLAPSTTTTQVVQEDVSVTTPETTSTTTAKITAEAVLEEVSHLLEKLREVAASMREAREEHERLAEAVAQVTAAVKDMGEHNMHIKKKVRKMSKGLKKNSHNKKIKDGIKSLQRDHQRILHAMSLNGINITRLHNHTRKHNLTHPRPANHKNQHGRNRKNHNNNKENHAATTTTTPAPENATKSPDQKALEQEVEGEAVKEALTVKRKGDDNDAVGGSTDNLIPELVVDPPSATDPPLPADCTEVMQRGNWTSGVYVVQPLGLQPIKVWCDHTTNGGGWTVLLARMEQANQEDFTKGWAEYKAGIGDPSAEHWLGLDALHYMTKSRNHELRVNITDWNNSSTWAEWKEFRVAPESEKYKLTVARYTSDSHAGDALQWHNGMKFSTPDRDNDVLLGGHCAKKNDGGWWYRGYRGCYQAHPTGRYQHNPGDPPKTSLTSRNFELGPVLVWQNWRGESYYPKTLFLMFRPSLN